MAEKQVADERLQELQQYSTCEISDALVKLNVPNAGFIPDLQTYSPSKTRKIIGHAFTVRMVHASDNESPKLTRHFVDAAIDAPQGSIMIIDAPAKSKNAVWGGLMTTRAKVIGLKGVIVHGYCRDLSEHREADFPVWAKGHSTVGQATFTRPSAIQIPLELGGHEMEWRISVKPLDILVADEDGVVAFDADLSSVIIELCQKGREVDAKCKHNLEQGKTIAETFALHRGK